MYKYAYSLYIVNPIGKLRDLLFSVMELSSTINIYAGIGSASISEACVISICMSKRNVTACEKKFSSAQFHQFEFFNTQTLWLLLSAKRRTTARFDGPRSNGFLSTPFCEGRAFDRRVNFQT